MRAVVASWPPLPGLRQYQGAALTMPRCQVCKEKYTRARPMQTTCDYPAPCALQGAKLKREKAQAKAASAAAKAEKKRRSDNRKAKRALNENTRSWWLKKTERIFNAWIRDRDAGCACHSCDTRETIRWNAGHYRPAGNNSFLRFHPLNVHLQCSQCNDGNKKSGNLTEYRIGLVKKLGVEVVEWLEGPHPLKRWTIDELREICEQYKLPPKRK